MENKLFLISLASLLVLVALVGCGSATPTPAPTQAAQVITVIITAVPPPPTATSAAPSITPLPTVGVTETVQAATPIKPTNTPGTPKPTATKKPVVVAPTATPTPLPLTLPAPKLVGPNFNPDTGQKDERHTPSDALTFEWQSISPLGSNVCYEIRVDLLPTNGQPGTGDAFMQCDTNETTKAQAQTVRFTLFQPNHTGVTYSGLLPNPSTDLWVQWYVTVVADQGAGAGPFDSISGIRHKVMPLSPKSETYKFLLKGGGQ
jgi:hypothetical protein